MEENTAKLNFVEAELNFIEIAVGSFAKDSPDEKKRKDFLKEELSLIPDESWRKQFYAYVRFSEEQLNRVLVDLQKKEVELQKEKNLLQQEKVNLLDLSAGNHSFILV
jgi:hypothetical protein